MPNSYHSFIQANDALAKCMAAQNCEQYKTMAAAEQANVCRSEAAAVREMLAGDQVHFRNLISERLAALKSSPQ